LKHASLPTLPKLVIGLDEAIAKSVGEKSFAIIKMNMEFLGFSLISFGVFMAVCKMLLLESGNYLMQFV